MKRILWSIPLAIAAIILVVSWLIEWKEEGRIISLIKAFAVTYGVGQHVVLQWLRLRRDE